MTNFPSNHTELIKRVTSVVNANPMSLTEIEIPNRNASLFKVDIPASNSACARVGLFTGVHGDEPAAIASILAFLEQRKWTEFPNFEFVVYPCINPTGFDLGIRENIDSQDINRSFTGKGTPESLTVRKSVGKQKFDLWIDAHEDPEETGYYMYPLFSDESWGPQIVKQVSTVGPINSKPVIDDRDVKDGLVSLPSRQELSAFMKTTDQWPLGLYAYSALGQNGMTTETPGQIDFDIRVQMQLSAQIHSMKLLQHSILEP